MCVVQKFYNMGYLDSISNEYRERSQASLEVIRKYLRSDSGEFVGELTKNTLEIATDEEIEVIKAKAEYIKANFKKVCVVGTGGSSLNGRLYEDFARYNQSGRKITIEHLENVDPFELQHNLDAIDPAETFFLVISKSGETTETLAILYSLLNRGFIHPNNSTFITLGYPSRLRRIAKDRGINIIDHKMVSGRFSAFSAVGLLPAALKGLNIELIVQYAKAKISQLLSKENQENLISTVSSIMSLMSLNYNQHVIMTYGECLRGFNLWYRQIWAETLGKNYLSSTPVSAYGTIDQHSQLQLFLGGSRNKFINVFSVDFSDKGDDISRYMSFTDKNKPLYMGDVMNVELRATVETLVERNIPTREFIIQKIDEKSISDLVVETMFETIFIAILMGINPYTQPAVESIKEKVKFLLNYEEIKIA